VYTNCIIGVDPPAFPKLSLILKNARKFTFILAFYIFNNDEKLSYNKSELFQIKKLDWEEKNTP